VFARFFWLLVADVVVLAWCGGGTPDRLHVALGQLASAYYFAHFLIILPLLSRYEKPLPLPSAIKDSVLHGEAAESAPLGQPARGGSVAAAE
jgi:ubiquinol-cytochrome c reductase cytochrome b subunit